MTISALRPGGKLTPQLLHELAQDPNLESFMIVCNWKNNTSSVSWSKMTSAELAFSLARAQGEILAEINDYN